MREYDVIVVGARCAGSPTGMLLAEMGYDVLVVDRARFPSDTISTHLIHPPGVGALDDWGLLDRVIGTGCPAIDTYAYDFEAATITGSPGTAYSPRRTVLDEILVHAASEAGAEVREGFAVDGLLIEDGRVCGIRGAETVRSRVVVGADGHHSRVAEWVGAEKYSEMPPLQVSYYTYVSGLPMDGRYECALRPGRGFAAWPTNDELTVVIAGWPRSEMAANRRDIEANWIATLELVPEFAARFFDGTRETRFVGQSLPNFFRKPFGAGWALVGDAGYTKDFITAYGITDAFRDAALCAFALDATFSGRSSFEAAMAEYQARRDGWSMPFYEFTTDLAMLEPFPLDLQRLLEAVEGDQEEMDDFARVAGLVMSPAEFFAPQHVEHLLAR